jgi:hypothetical protein
VANAAVISGGYVSGSTASTSGTADIVALSVHGPTGVLDLVVPSAASAADVAVEYAQQARLGVTPSLCSSVGRPLPADVTLADAGIDSGAVLVAVTPGPVAPQRGRARRRAETMTDRATAPGPLSVLWFCTAAAAAVLAGWFAAPQENSDLRSVTIGLLIGAAVLGCVPVGRFAVQRVLAAPAFAGAAAFAIVWDPEPVKLPTILGVSALAAAVVAAVGRALDEYSEEALRVWMLVGTSVFLLTGGAALADVHPQVVWTVLLVTAMLAARFVPMLAVEVPDQFLIDLERLAVTAWSARERPKGRRGRTIVPRKAVAVVASRGTRVVTAASAAVLAVVAVSAPLLLASATLSMDRIGAWCLVGFAGAALLLAARSYRHTAARALLRTSGLVCWAALLVVVFDAAGPRTEGFVAGSAVFLAFLVLMVAVALGRGWRSAWWSRRAEIAEAICGAFAVGAVVVAVGLFRHLWELTS